MHKQRTVFYNGNRLGCESYITYTDPTNKELKTSFLNIISEVQLGEEEAWDA